MLSMDASTGMWDMLTPRLAATDSGSYMVVAAADVDHGWLSYRHCKDIGIGNEERAKSAYCVINDHSQVSPSLCWRTV